MNKIMFNNHKVVTVPEQEGKRLSKMAPDGHCDSPLFPHLFVYWSISVQSPQVVAAAAGVCGKGQPICIMSYY